MRFSRIIIAVVVIVPLLAAIATFLLIRDQARVVALVLRRLKAQAGIEIVAGPSRMTLGSRVVITLDRPIVQIDGRRVAVLSRLEVAINYNALIFHEGLPLAKVVLERPAAAIESLRALSSGATAVKIGPEAAAELVRAAGALAKLVRRVDVIDGSLIDARGAAVVSGLSIEASRHRFRPGPWQIDFLGHGPGAGLGDLDVAGDFALHIAESDPEQPVLHGELWWWNTAPSMVSAAGIDASGRFHGSAMIAMHGSGLIDGNTKAAADGLTIGGQRVSKPLAAGNVVLDSVFSATAQRIDLTALALHQSGKPLLQGECHLNGPYADDPAAGCTIGGLRVAMAQAKALVPSIRGLPDWVAPAAAALGNSGSLAIDQVAFDMPLSQLRAGGIALVRQLNVAARSNDLSIALPARLRLPNLDKIAIKLALGKGMLSATQGTGRLGESSVGDFGATLDLARGFAAPKYDAHLDASLDVGELFLPAIAMAGPSAKVVSDKVARISGRVALRTTARGTLSASGWNAPERYEARVAVDSRPIELAINGIAGPIKVIGGSATVKPGRIAIDRLNVAPIAGTAMVSGEIDSSGKRPDSLTADLSGVPAERWLPLAGVSDIIAVRGPVAGRVTIKRARDGELSARGGLKIGPGEIQPTFLRSPMIVKTADLRLNGRGAVLDLSRAKLEGAPLDFVLAISDFANPTLRIDASADYLDIEALKFVRLPWSPPTPVMFGPTPISGHVEVHHGKLERLAMSNLTTDFTHDGKGWRVYNLGADALGGRITLELQGRHRHDWIGIKGHLQNVNVKELLALPENAKPVLSGTMNADLDLWANTDGDFFQTLSGSMNFNIVNGELKKFTLLSRLLGFIDLKTWLTASVPDPRVAGLPFSTLRATFAGEGGIMQTNDLILDGPAMDIAATGYISTGDKTLNMSVGMFPFRTVNWLVGKIPILGNALGTTLVAAYFKVHGPVSDPKVTPQPVTSVAEFVKHTLGMPINLIRPGTVK